MNWLGSAGVPFCWSPLTFLKWLQLFGSWRVRDGLLPCLGPWCCLSGGLLTPLGPSSLGSLGKTHRASWNIPRTRTGSCKVSSCPSFMSTVFYQPNLTQLRSKWWGNWATPPDGRSYKVTGSKGRGPREMGRICSLVSSTTKLKEVHETGYWHLWFRQGPASGRILINTYCIEPDWINLGPKCFVSLFYNLYNLTLYSQWTKNPEKDS